MGSSCVPHGDAPQQDDPVPETTRRAASPYFSLTISLMSMSGVLTTGLLSSSIAADNLLRLNRFIARAALGIKKAKQLRQHLTIGPITQEGALALHRNQLFISQFVQMMGKRGIGNIQLFSYLAHHHALRVGAQEQPHDAKPGFCTHGGKHVSVADTFPGLSLRRQISSFSIFLE